MVVVVGLGATSGNGMWPSPTSADDGADKRAQAEWTVLVFLNADNNLEPFGLKDFAEMAKVGSTDKVNVVVQFDRIPGYATDAEGDWTGTLRFKVTKDMKPTTANAVEDLGEVDMGDGKTLADFVEWGIAKYPAKRYMLVIWDHGQGWRLRQAVTPPHMAGKKDVLTDMKQQAFKMANKAFDPSKLPIPVDRVIPNTHRYISIDETSNSKLYNREIQDALRVRLQGKRLDVIGFDACLMSMIETGFAMREIAEVMVGSQELEPGDGWNYEKVLQKLTADPTADGRKVGKMVVEAYKENYETIDGETTMAALDLDRIEGLAGAVSGLATECSDKLATEVNHIKTARGNCAVYAPGYGLHGIDLARFCEQLEAATGDVSIQVRARAVRDGVKATVLANYAGSARQGNFGSAGIGIYFPRGKSAFQSDPDGSAYTDANTSFPVEFVQKYRWDNFLSDYFAVVP